MADPSTTQETKNDETTREPFKKPVLIGRIGKLPKKAKSEPEKAPDIPPKDRNEPSEGTPESNSKSATPQVTTKEISVSVPYKEPKWSGVCPDGSGYALEVLKSGMIVELVDLSQQPYFVFGRLPNCDVVMAHPTISRHHCILQYKAFAEADEPASGWYLFDLGSTHGTYLNKDKLKEYHYTRVRVGHQIKFGSSTRTYILTGPDFDCEGESELSVTQIKQKAQEMKLERERMIREAKERKEIERLEEAKKREEQGIDWGMGEDAEDETDLSENPFAVTTNEELYLTDPKKTLRGYFEREGHELQYDCEERSQGQYLCKVELPMDDARGRPVVAEAIHTGKKKEAVVACALEACRILDRAGLLRQAKHESRRRKERDWSADDFYDSDDDNYLDRTGQVEKKRRGRMLRHGALPSEQGALTYEQLLKQISELESKIAVEERTLERLRESTKTRRQADADVDDLDHYMATLAAPTMSVKAEISTSKMTVQKLRVELARSHRLAELVRPADLPPIIKKDTNRIRINNSVVYGKRIKLKTDSEKKATPTQVNKQEEKEFIEEVDSDEEDRSKYNKDNIRDTNDGQECEKSKSHDKKDSISKSEISSRIRTKDITSRIDSETRSVIDDVKIPTSGSKDTLKRDKTKDVSKCSSDPTIGDDDSKVKSDNPTIGNEGYSESESKVKGNIPNVGNVKIYGPMRPPDDYVMPEDYFNQESDRDLPEIMEE